jgi:RNA recognition motif-containing protein
MAESVPATVDNVNGTPPVDEQPGHKVFAGNLAYTTNDEGLKAFFSPVAEDIVSAQVIFRGTRSAGYGFVAFKSAEAAHNAVDLLNKKELDGRTLIVEVAKPPEEKQKEKKEKRASKKRTTTKKTKPNATDANATGNNTEAATDKGAESGDGAKSKKKRNPRKTKKPRAATTNGDAPAEGAAPAEPKPKKVKTPRAPKPTRPAGEAPEGEPSKTMLFVANLGFSVDDAALSEVFTSNGVTVVSARVVRRRWGQPRRSKGYGFVDVGSEEQQAKALELLQGKELGGREIAVKIAVNAQVKEAEEAAAADNAAVPSLITA